MYQKDERMKETCDFRIHFCLHYLHDVLHSHVFDCFLGNGIATEAAAAAAAAVNAIAARVLFIIVCYFRKLVVFGRCRCRCRRRRRRRPHFSLSIIV